MTVRHSAIGASSASRWFACPGSVRLSTQVPPKEDSIYSAQGSAAHAAIDDFLSRREKGETVDIYDYIGFEYEKGEFEVELSSEDVDAMAEFIKAVDEIRAKGKFILHTEAKFHLNPIYEGLFGTSDVVLISSDLKKLVVIDYKHGSGVPVEVKENKQLMYYALGAIQYVIEKHKLDPAYIDIAGWGGVFQEVEVVIVQPRCRHHAGAVRPWKVPAKTLDDFAEELGKRARETANPNAALVPGEEQCRWCPALAICPAFGQKTFEIAKADFAAAAPVFPKPDSLAPKDIARIMKFEPLMQEWLKSVSVYALHCLEHGQEIPGFKLVEKRANRKWTDEAAAQETLELVVNNPDDLIEKSFISPAKAEKLIGGKKGKDFVNSLVTIPQTGHTLAPDHDPREPIAGSAVEDFRYAPEARQ